MRIKTIQTIKPCQCADCRKMAPVFVPEAEWSLKAKVTFGGMAGAILGAIIGGILYVLLLDATK